MKITVCEDEGRFDCTAAWRIVGQLLAKPASVIGLSTGRTTRNLHLQVDRMWREMPFDVTRVTFFGLDEVVNVPRTYKGACYRMLHDELTDHLGLPDDQLLMLPTSSAAFPSCTPSTSRASSSSRWPWRNCSAHSPPTGTPAGGGARPACMPAT